MVSKQLSKLTRIISLLLILSLALQGCFKPEPALKEKGEGKKLLIFAGAASKPPAELVARAFEKKTGIKVELVFGGSGYVLSQMKLAQKGDIYFPGSSDFMEIAKRENVVYPETEKYVVYLVPAINVQKGNPQSIKNLKDLTRPGLKIAIANPEGVCVGLYAVEIIENFLTAKEKEAFRANLVNYTESCEKTATVVALGAVDAVIGWSVFQYWNPEKIETVPLKPEEVIRIGYIPIAISKYTENKELAQQFIDFLVSEEGKAIFRKYHYFMSPEEAVSYIGANRPVGGQYSLPQEWIHK